MHEVRRFSGELSSYAEELSKTVSNNPQSSRVVDLANNVFYASGLLTARLGFTDLELNPDSIKQQITLRTGIYKKFEKARYILMRKAKARDIDIKFEGNSFLEIDAIQAFELVPFVVLDNALKYSPKSQSINVRFEEESNKSLVVRVSNLGPAVENNEIPGLFGKGVRGGYANKSLIGGEGLGLYLAKSLCDISGVGIKVNIGDSKNINFTLEGIPYSEFYLIMEFKKR